MKYKLIESEIVNKQHVFTFQKLLFGILELGEVKCCSTDKEWSRTQEQLWRDMSSFDNVAQSSDLHEACMRALNQLDFEKGAEDGN